MTVVIALVLFFVWGLWFTGPQRIYRKMTRKREKEQEAFDMEMREHMRRYHYER